MGYPQFVLRNLSLVGVPFVWWEYQQFGGGTLSLVPVHWFGDGTLGYFQFGWGSLGLVWEPLVTVSFGLGTLSFLGYPWFVWVPLVWWGYLSLVGYSQYGWGTIALEGVSSI